MAVFLKYYTLFLISNHPDLNYLHKSNKDTLCHNVILNRYFICNNSDTLESGIIIKNKYIKCDIQIDENYYVFFFNGIKHQPYPLSLNCADIYSNDIFNKRKDGTKTGIWIKWYPWGKIKSATMYINNKPDRIVKFNIIGNISLLIINKNKRPHYIFYKNGYPKNQLKDFY